MKLTVNGVEHQVPDGWQNENLLTVSPERLGLTGSRFSCGIGQCGICVIHVDGATIASCILSVTEAIDKAISAYGGSGLRAACETH